MEPTSFQNPWWLKNAHLQTLWPTFCRRSIINLPLAEERLELPDGDFVDLAFLGRKNQPYVLILHGFEGSIKSPYAKGMMSALHQQGWCSVFMHFRGCSGEPNRLPRSYHSGDTADLEYVINLLRKRQPNFPIAVIGYSLGGNVLLKWLGETGNNNPLAAAVAISVPFELKKAAAKLKKGFSQLYQWHFLKCLRERLDYKFKQYPLEMELPPLKQLRTLEEFDDKITAPMHGFLNGEDYYVRSSSRQYLRHIQIPTLIVHSKDDPFICESAIPEPQDLSAHIELEITQGGGHVGFVTGRFPWQAEYWLEQRVPSFLDKHLR